MNLDYFNKSGEKSLSARLSARVDRKPVTIADVVVDFYSMIDTPYTKLGTAKTDKGGQAIFNLPAGLDPADGVYAFQAVFNGTDGFSSSERSIEIKDVYMKISFSQENKEKKINLEVTEVSGEGALIPLSEETIKIYVPRTFTLLPIGDATTDEGMASLDFPTDLPGDTLGHLTIVAKIEDHADYGNVEVAESINWGKPVPLMEVESRGLGDTNAPLWMVYTLIVLLSTVWLHYLYSIYAIYQINQEGKKAGISLD